MAGVKVIDKDSQQVVEVSSAEADDGLKAGRYGTVANAGPVKVIREGNRTGTVAPEDLLTAQAEGWTVASDEEHQSSTLKREESGVLGGVQGGLEAGAAGLSFGLSSLALEGMGMDPERMKARREGLGTGAMVAEGVGALGGALLTGGLGTAGTAARGGLAAGKVARGLGALGAPARMLGRAERAGAAALGGGRMARVTAATGRGAVDGFFAGAGAKIDENVLGERKQTAESIFIDGGVPGALFGGALGGALPIAAEVASGAGKVSESAMRRVIGHGTGAPGGQSGKLAAQEMTAAKVPWRQSAADKIGGAAEATAFMSGTRKEVAGRSFRKAVMEPKRITDLLSRRGEIEERLASTLRDGLGRAGKGLDSAHIAAQGASKYRRVAKTMPRNADGISPRYSEGLRGSMEKRLADMEATNAQQFGRAYDVGALREAQKITKRTFEQMVESPTAIGAYKAMDTLKRDMAPLIERTGGFGGKPRFGATSDMIDTNKELRSMYGELKDHLERGDLWGEGGSVQKELNASYSASMRAKAEFKNEASGTGLSRIFKEDGSVNMQQALRVVRQYNRPGGGEVVNALDDVLEKQLDHLRVVKKHYELDGPQAKSISEAESGVADFRKAMKEQAKDAEDMADFQEMRGAESGGSVSIGIGSNMGTAGGAILGSALGGPIGAMAGMAAGAVLRPYTAARTLASLMSMADRVGAARLGATGGMLGRIAGPSASKLKSIGRGAGEGYKRAIAPIVYATSGDRKKSVNSARKEAAMLATNPGELQKRLESRMQVVADVAPGVANEVGKVAQRAARFLASNAPPTYAPQFTGGDPIVEPAAADRYLRYVEAIQSPMETLAGIDSGALTVDHVKAIREVYPSVYGQVVDDFTEALALAQAEGRAVPYSDLRRLSVLLDIPATMRPSQFAIIQSTYGTMEQQEAEAAPAAGGGIKKGTAGDMAANDMTAAQRVESGAARA